MDHENISVALGKIFGLKHVAFKTFDTTPLNLRLNKTEERVLMMAWHHGGAPMQLLSHEVGLEKGSLTSVIDSLEAKGLVARERDANDRRSFIVAPTPAGVRLAEKIEELFREHVDTLLGKLTKEERTEFENAILSIARLIPILAS